jgi:hypothetical protein
MVSVSACTGEAVMRNCAVAAIIRGAASFLVRCHLGNPNQFAPRANSRANDQDCTREVKPPFSPESVVSEYASLLKTYHVGSVRGIDMRVNGRENNFNLTLCRTNCLRRVTCLRRARVAASGIQTSGSICLLRGRLRCGSFILSAAAGSHSTARNRAAAWNGRKAGSP